MRLAEALMPGDPKECREHAKHCAELAMCSSSAVARERLEELAKTWLRLAVDLETSLALLDEWAKTRRNDRPLAARFASEIRLGLEPAPDASVQPSELGEPSHPCFARVHTCRI
jgi:hypothetical protein